MLLAAVPGLFAVHQFTEGFLWLELGHRLSATGLLAVMLVKWYAFTSLWCTYAAVVSMILYFFFRRSREVRPLCYAVVT